MQQKIPISSQLRNSANRRKMTASIQARTTTAKRFHAAAERRHC